MNREVLVPDPDVGTNGKFFWGAATAAYQVRGSPLADGAGSCVWHEFSHTPGTTHRGQTGDIAADHYHRWPADVEPHEKYGPQQLSVFGALAPHHARGHGRSSTRAGLSFYDRLVDALLSAGIEPFVTLFHWDYRRAFPARRMVEP